MTLRQPEDVETTAPDGVSVVRDPFSAAAQRGNYRNLRMPFTIAEGNSGPGETIVERAEDKPDKREVITGVAWYASPLLPGVINTGSFDDLYDRWSFRLSTTLERTSVQPTPPAPYVPGESLVFRLFLIDSAPEEVTGNVSVLVAEL